MNETEELLAWGKTIRQSLDLVINKLEEKIDLDEEDSAFFERMHLVFEEGIFEELT